MKQKQILDYLKNKADAPLTLSRIARGIGLPRKTSLKTLKRLLNQLVEEGSVVCIRGNRYGVAERMDLVAGHIQVHPNGYGFLIPEKTAEEDVFINPRNLQEVQDGDKVVVRVQKHKDGLKREGQVIRVVERARQQVVGRYEKEHNFGYVVPIDPKLTQDVIIPPGKGLRARPGQLVVAQLIRYPTHQRNPEGKIVEVLGDSDTPGIETEAIIRNYQLPLDFPPEALAEAAAYPDRVEADSQRRDLRDWLIFTIDGENARDFDDAISLHPLEDGGWQLGVHIADVSYYVTPGSALDKEAYQRGCSVYFPQRVIPMLPERLSNGLCSLNPGVDRLAFSVCMDFDPEGELLGYQLFDSLIKSCARLTYIQVKAMLADEEPETCQRYAHILPTLRKMNNLASLLKQQRLRQGSLDFDLPEPEVILDLQGQTQDIIKRERNLAHELIEDFMLAANRTVATHMAKLELPFIYRIHEKPDPLKLAELAEFVKNFGYHLETAQEVTPGDLQNLLPQIKDTPEETIITIHMLRSLKLARYTIQNLGHFGLAMSHYTHFTSPIRRYPDLIVHRLLRTARNKKKLSPSKKEAQQGHLEAIALQSSLRERTAEKAERDIIQIKRTQFMAGKLGEEFASIVCGVTPFGLLIELEDFYIEGLIHVSNMRDDYYHYLEREQALVGERCHQRYAIGDKLLVQVERVNVDRRRIDFNLVKRLEQ